MRENLKETSTDTLRDDQVDHDKYFYKVRLFALFAAMYCLNANAQLDTQEWQPAPLSEQTCVRQTGDYPETTRIDFCGDIYPETTYIDSCGDIKGYCRTVGICFYPEVCSSPTLSPSGRYAFFFRRDPDKSVTSEKIVIYDSRIDGISAEFTLHTHKISYHWIHGDNIIRLSSGGTNMGNATVLKPTGEKIGGVASSMVPILSKNRRYLLTFSSGSTPVASIAPPTVYQLPEGKEVARSDADQVLQEVISISWYSDEVSIRYRDLKNIEKILRLKLPKE